MSLGFVFLFIIPYTIIEDLNFSRNIFLWLPFIILILSVLKEFRKHFNKFKKGQNRKVKTPIIIGIGAILSVFSLPVTILCFGR